MKMDVYFLRIIIHKEIRLESSVN